MAAIWLPSDDRHTLALREPNLLVPGKKPSAKVLAKNTPLAKYMTAAFYCDAVQHYTNGNVSIPRYSFLQGRVGTLLATAGDPTALGLVNGATGLEIGNTGSADYHYVKPNVGADFTPPYGDNKYVMLVFGCTLNIFTSDIGVWGLASNDPGVWWDASAGSVRLNVFGGTHSYNTNFVARNTVGEYVSAVVLIDFANNQASIFENGLTVVDNASVGTLAAYDGSTISSVPHWFGSDTGKSGFRTTNNATWSHYVQYDIPFRPATGLMRDISRNPFAYIYEPANDTPYLISVPTGGATYTGTGSVASQSSAIAGTAEREITGTSALESQSSTIAGTGAIGGAITGTAVLAAQSSTIVGTGTRVITSAAELVSQASVIAGAAERVITGISGIEAQSSTITGTGTVAAAGTVTGTGDLDSQSSTISGTGILERTGTGAIAASVASIDATGIITRVGTGALASQASSIAGTGTVSTPQTITGTGSLVCGVASISGNQQAPIWTAIARVETVWTEI